MRFHTYTGTTAWILHRVTGLAIVVYLFMHIWTISHLSDPDTFNQWMEFYSQPLFKLGEIALLAAVIFHALNGIRIIWIDFGQGARYHRRLFWAVVAISAIVFVASAIPLVQQMLRKGAGG